MKYINAPARYGNANINHWRKTLRKHLKALDTATGAKRIDLQYKIARLQQRIAAYK